MNCRARRLTAYGIVRDDIFERIRMVLRRGVRSVQSGGKALYLTANALPSRTGS
jgi:hypothetical protein